IGLALGSGVARGWTHIGVLRALQKEGIEPDVICGTSIGALVGGAYLTGHLDYLEKWARGLTKRGLLKYLDVRFSGGGLIGGKRFDSLYKESLGDASIEDLDRPFAAVATDLATGHEVWIQKGKLESAIRASYALPGIFSPVKRESRWLVDGALVNPVPVTVCRALGAQVVIAVNLNADIAGRARVNGTIETDRRYDDFDIIPPKPSRAATLNPSNILMRQIFGHEQGRPSTINVMIGALNIIQDRLSRSRFAGDPPDVHVLPLIGHIGLLEFDRADEAIAEGEKAMHANMPFVRQAVALLS
ncbi:MAG: patatin-like phospholipase family protein, partial [Rhodospirillales bacterium]|nr:patatin-like phospholipase family protein [Rhodospirillales bacterium]